MKVFSIVSIAMIWLCLDGKSISQNVPAYESICLASMTCGECIKQDPSCGWCTEVGYTGARCDNVDNMILKGCANITNPTGSVTVVQNDTLTDAKDSPDGFAVQVTPQHINITLKIGEPQTVSLYIRLANDYPLDLYYLMDLSKSQQDDLLNLRMLGELLARELNTLTEDHQLGFGAFVDKVSLPFVVAELDTCRSPGTTDDGKNPCCSTCVNPFSFRNELPLTNNTDMFAARVRELTISTSLDSPEGGLDALVQVIRCQEQIGWRKRARRMVVLATDDTFHMAGDGKMAGVTKPNDGQCHLQPGSNEYLKSKDMDYPSIGQINKLVQEYNIIPVFAVRGKFVVLYQELQKLIKGSHVGELATDSRNIVNLVKLSYKSITSKVDIVDTAPDNIELVYTSNCGEGVPSFASSGCSGIAIGDTVSFDIQLTASDCSQEQQIFTVRPLGFDESLTIVADIICNCNCEGKGIRDAANCSGNGTLLCGQCECNEGRYGQNCQCDGESGSDENYDVCFAPNSTAVCQGRGSCMCGKCECDQTKNPDHIISGKYCECDNFSCTRHQGLLCGGKSHGECTCGGICKCKPGYTGDGCDCKRSTKACETASGLLCNGFGQCKCGQCVCEKGSPFYGLKCEDCANCVGKCSSFRECVLCNVFEQGAYTKEKCDMCTVQIEIVDIIYLNSTETKSCEYVDDDNCTVKYSYGMMENATYIVYVQKAKECRKIAEIVPQKNINLTWLLVGIIGAILAIGIALLALLRLAFFIQDKRECAKFEKERLAALWSDSDNPLFKSSTSTFLNPMHGK